jgi:hypothetical protein
MGNKLSRDQVEAICRRVYARFPELRGTRPRVKPRCVRDQERFVLRFDTKASTSDGASLPMIVRAVADSSGRILKLTSSR